MRSQRGKQSEIFSPSVVMRKWLNIKTKLNDFNEDEFDTESEDNDGSYCANGFFCADGFFRMCGNKYTVNESIYVSRVFWFGDLNYRIDILDAEVQDLVATRSWDYLLKFDQLTKELISGSTFACWKEGLINFAPTYKYEINSSRYVGDIPNEGEKKRTPAWCDRILWVRSGIRQLSYWSSGLSISDHRPVSSTFLVEVEVLNQRKLERALNFSSTSFAPEDGDIHMMFDL